LSPDETALAAALGAVELTPRAPAAVELVFAAGLAAVELVFETGLAFVAGFLGDMSE
jgi:hypothetical protein